MQHRKSLAGAALLCGKDGEKRLAAAKVFSFPTEAGGRYVLTPVPAVEKPAFLEAVRNVGPKWPHHSGPNDTAEAYVKRKQGFGFLGITADGQNPARKRVQQALQAKPVK